MGFQVLRRRKVLLGARMDVDSGPEIRWYGAHLDSPSWDDPELRTLCCRFGGREAGPESPEYHLFFILHADWREQAIELPPLPDGKRWHRVIDTSLPPGEDFSDPGKTVMIDPPEYYIANPRSTVVLLGK